MFDTNHLLVFFTAATVILVAYPKFMQPGGLLFNDSGPQIDAPCGKIKGTFSYTRWSQKSIAQFTGIPYAQPPVGQMRFLRPKPFEDRQNRVIDATQRPVRCVQPELMIPGLSYTGQEDCLVLNVYVPEKMDTDLDEDLPVMVFIHGGGLVTGESGMYGPKYLLERNVILVTINYRLGPLGFLNLGTEDDSEDSSIPAGNQGLWDQMLALKWVRRNIGSFGGDPERVTIFGESAGGWSVSYHLISEQSKGLFHRAIVQSGSLLTSYLYTSASEDFLEQHKTFASHLGCQKTSDRLAISHCLRNKSPAEIMDKLFSLDGFANFHSVHGIPNPNIWKGTLVKGRQKSFFQAEPKDTVIEGRLSHPQSVPVMMGFTQDEGLLDTAPLLNDPEKFNLLKNNWDKSSISFLPWLSPGNQANVQDMGRAIKEFYFNNEVLDGSKHFGNLTDMFSDVEFIYGTDFTARTLSERNPVYYYSWEHVTAFSLADLFLTRYNLVEVIAKFTRLVFGTFESESLGVAHADDVLTLFNLAPLDDYFNLVPRTEDDTQFQKRVVDLWANFATFGQPLPRMTKSVASAQISDLGAQGNSGKWNKVSSKSSYVRLKTDGVYQEKNVQLEERLALWRRLIF